MIATTTAAGAANYDYTGLSAYSEIRVVIQGVTMSGASNVVLRVSTDNGSTFLATAADYLTIAGNGVQSGDTSLKFYDAAAAAARYGEIIIQGFNLTAVKTSRSNFFSSDGVFLRFMPSTSAFNAIRVLALAGTLNAGTITVFGRQ